MSDLAVGSGGRPDQDRLAAHVEHRREIQPAAAHRRARSGARYAGRAALGAAGAVKRRDPTRAAAALRFWSGTGLARRRRADDVDAAPRRRVVGHLARGPAGTLDLRQVRAAATQGRADMARAVERNAYEWAWINFAARALPRQRARAAGVRSCAGHFRDGLSRASPAIRTGSGCCSTARRARRRPASARSSRACTRRAPAMPTVANAFRSDAIFHAIRLEPYLLATAVVHPDLAARCDRFRTHGDDALRARPRRRQPEEHPARTARTGAPRRRVRVVWRSGIRRRRSASTISC